MSDRLIELDPNDFALSWDEPTELDEAYPGDATHCAVGRHCVGLHAIGDREYPAIVATYLREDPNTGYEHEAWATCFYFESLGPVLDGKPTAICEDCATFFDFSSYDWYAARPEPSTGYPVDLNEVLPIGEPMFEDDTTSGVVWTIGVNDRGTFFAHLATYAPDHGMSWESELGVHDTVLDALTAVGDWARKREAELDKLEASLAALEPPE